MLKVARSVAMDLYELPTILRTFNVSNVQWNKIKDHPQFLRYLKAEKEAWQSADNAAERTKLKAGIVMEEWMGEASAELLNRKNPLNHRVELAKLLAKVAGVENNAVTPEGNAGGFKLTINIGAVPQNNVTIDANATRRKDVKDAQVVEHEEPATGENVEGDEPLNPDQRFDLDRLQMEAEEEDEEYEPDLEDDGWSPDDY